MRSEPFLILVAIVSAVIFYLFLELGKEVRERRGRSLVELGAALSFMTAVSSIAIYLYR
jgi:hypothetical protein